MESHDLWEKPGSRFLRWGKGIGWRLTHNNDISMTFYRDFFFCSSSILHKLIWCTQQPVWLKGDITLRPFLMISSIYAHQSIPTICLSPVSSAVYIFTQSSHTACVTSNTAHSLDEESETQWIELMCLVEGSNPEWAGQTLCSSSAFHSFHSQALCSLCSLMRRKRTGIRKVVSTYLVN